MTIYKILKGGVVVRVELRRSVCNTPFTREVRLKPGTREHRTALSSLTTGA